LTVFTSPDIAWETVRMGNLRVGSMIASSSPLSAIHPPVAQ